MSQPVIQVKNLSKKYKLGATLSHDTLRDYLTHSFKSLWCKKHGNGNFNNPKIVSKCGSSFHDKDELWAVKNVSFNVNHGEVVGIIGKNGAGKSTILKLLSQITEPTEGEIRIRGIVSSLLEVGTGFHPELSGRENIYLNGAILGMSKSSIDRRFGDIVNFAEIERFIDTPVKRYSSGMYVRLAFSVAAHLEPDILIVDEVLSVGDAMFRKKCLGKMNKVAKEGRTVLFVSHNMKAIEMLCDRVILLDKGKIVRDCEPSDAVSYYLGGEKDDASTEDKADFFFPDESNKPGQINRLRIINSEGQLSYKHNILNPIKIVVDFELRINFPTVFLQAEIRKLSGEGDSGLFLTQYYDWENYQKGVDKMVSFFPMERGKYTATLNLVAPLLNRGVYQLELYLTTGPFRQDTVGGIFFEIIDQGSFASVVRNANRGGFLAYPLKWEIKKL